MEMFCASYPNIGNVLFWYPNICIVCAGNKYVYGVNYEKSMVKTVGGVVEQGGGGEWGGQYQ